MQVVILCGGQGLRMWPLTEETPKPLIEIGGKAILWHIMKRYASYGHTDFILCVGHKGEKILEYFESREHREPGWNIRCVDTGRESKKAERIAGVKEFITGDQFLLSYGDDLSSVDVNAVIAFHNQQQKMVTLTSAPLYSEFGILEINNKHEVQHFREKPRIPEYWINGGFYVCSRDVFNFLHLGEFEDEVLKHLAAERQVAAFEFEGFWKAMNTGKDATEFNLLFDSGNPPWKNW